MTEHVKSNFFSQAWLVLLLAICFGALLAAVQITLSLVGVLTLGLAGVILAHGLTILLTYPLRVWLISRYDAWDPKGEFGLMGLGFAITGRACWLQWDSLSALW